jgi:large repetitive protein
MSCLPSDAPVSHSSCVQDQKTSHLTPSGSQPAGRQLTPANPCRDRRSALKRLTRQTLQWAFTWAALVLPAVGVFAQSPTFPATAVGTASAQVTVTVTAPLGGEVSNVEVLTIGARGLDFAAGSGASCQSRELDPNQTCQQSVVFTPSYPGMRMGAVVLIGELNGEDNKVLGTAYLSGVGSSGLGVMAPGNVTAVAGVYRQWTSTRDNILATSADLETPSGVVLDGTGNMYIADGGHNKIRIVAPPVSPATAGIIHTFAGSGDAGFSGDGGSAAAANLNSPTGIALDGAGNLYIADTGNNRIRKVTPAGKITTIVGNGVAGYAGDNQVAGTVTTQLNQPLGVTVDYAGNLYIADTSNQSIRRVDAVTGVITTVAGNGVASGLGDGRGTYSGDNGAATSAGLSLPYAVAFDASGNMFIPDSANDCVRRVDAVTQIITTVAGIGGQPGSPVNGTSATSTRLNEPSGVAVDAAGNLYIADTQNAAIRKVNFATGQISTLIANGAGNALSTSNALAPVQIYAPVGVYLDGAGNLFFADLYYMLVSKIDSSRGVLNFTATKVQLGSQSPSPLVQTLENDGNAPLNLTSLTNDANAVIDTVTTTCSLTSPLAQDTDCAIGAYFAPSLAITIPTGASQLQVDANVNAAGTMPVSPLDVIVVGDAVPVNATTLVLVSSPASPSTYGQNVTFTATVSSGATPTGSVAFTIDGVTTVPASVNVSSAGNNSAVATYTTTAPLAVGAHTVLATFTSAKSANFLSSNSTLTQAVNEATAVAVTSSAGRTAVLGTSVRFTAKVVIFGGGGVTPDGTVTFYDGAIPIGSPVAIDDTGTASVSIASLSSGTHQIVAVFGGDPNTFILGSRSASLNLDVQGTSALQVNSTPNPSIYGNSVTFVATVTSNSGVAATGTVKFLDGTTQIGTATLAGNPGAASFAISTLTAGSHSISASYQGDQNNGPASASVAQTVNLTPTVTLVSATPDPGIAGKAVTLTATVTVASGTGKTTGTVTFTDGSAILGTATVGAGGTASLNKTLFPGPHAIVATYGGDGNDNGSASAPLALPINLAATAVALTSSASPATVLSAVTFTAAVTGNGGVPTGTVTFAVDGAAVNTATLDATGKASFSDSNITVGSHAVTASYSGDTNDNSSVSSALTQAMHAIATTTSLGTGATAGPAPQTVLIATVEGTSGPTATGTVTFTNGSIVIGTATLDATGVGTLLPDLAPSSYNLTANYSGDSLHSASSSSAVKVSGIPTGFGITVNPATITMATSQNSIVTVSVQSTNGFADTIGFGCGTLPAGLTCHFANETLSLKAGGTQAVQLTIDTNSPLGGGSTAMNSGSSVRRFSLAGLFLPAGLLFGWVGSRFRKRNGILFAAILALFLSGTLMVTGCGASFSQMSVAPGTYTIQITGVGSNSNITHYQNITLTITK